MTNFSWETYGQQRQPIEPAGFFAAFCGYMRALFQLAASYTRRG